MGAEISVDELGPEYKGYIFKITGGNDKDGFPMKQGVLHKGRVRLLFSDGHSCFRVRRSGEKKRKTIRGCIVGPDIRVLAVAIMKKGDADIAGKHIKRVINGFLFSFSPPTYSFKSSFYFQNHHHIHLF